MDEMSVMRPRTIPGILVAIALLAGCEAGEDTSVLADDSLARAHTLAATCAACHGTEGRSADPSIPSLAGNPDDLLVEQLAEMRGDEYEGRVMHQLVQGYSEEEIRLIASHLSRLGNEEPAQ